MKRLLHSLSLLALLSGASAMSWAFDGINRDIGQSYGRCDKVGPPTEPGSLICADRFEAEDTGFPPDCTVGNWLNAVGLADDDTGHQGDTNRRYGGPCGLRIALDGEPRYVETLNPWGESSYLVRFYAFPDNAGSGAVELFQTDAFSIFYDSGNFRMDVDHAGGTESIIFAGVESGWQSIHASWEASTVAEVSFLVANRNTVDGSEKNVTLDTSGISINYALLGNINGADTGGSVDFDDFESTRITPPDRLFRGDANDDWMINISDLVATLAEMNENAFAAGQPDCNEDGAIDNEDLACILDVVLQETIGNVADQGPEIVVSLSDATMPAGSAVAISFDFQGNGKSRGFQADVSYDNSHFTAIDLSNCLEGSNTYLATCIHPDGDTSRIRIVAFSDPEPLTDFTGTVAFTLEDVITEGEVIDLQWDVSLATDPDVAVISDDGSITIGTLPDEVFLDRFE